jgi:hypothetical protein
LQSDIGFEWLEERLAADLEDPAAAPHSVAERAPFAPILMRLPGAFGPNTDAGTIVGNPAARIDEAARPLPASFMNSRRFSPVFSIFSPPMYLYHSQASSVTVSDQRHFIRLSAVLHALPAGSALSRLGALSSRLMPHGHTGESFGVRKLACAFGAILENRAVFESGSELPHPKAPSGRKNYAALAKTVRCLAFFCWSDLKF